jgi:hypothetical protein
MQGMLLWMLRCIYSAYGNFFPLSRLTTFRNPSVRADMTCLMMESL